MGSFNWAPIIQAGVDILKGENAHADSEAGHKVTIDVEAMRQEGKERDRVAAAERQRLSDLAADGRNSESIAGQIEQVKKRVLGDVLLTQGKSQGDLLLESFRAKANRPEKFNDAASILARVLAS